MAASVRRADQRPDQALDLRFPVSGSAEVTFTGLARYQRYRVAVTVPGHLVPREVIVDTREASQRVVVTIPFGEFRVEARPGFDLYVSRSRRLLAPAPGAPCHPETYVARSGPDGAPVKSAYLVAADSEGVRFLYWPVPAFFAVLEATASATEDHTEVLDFKASVDRTIVKGPQIKPFQSVVLRTIRAPQLR
jgi:hypothetical protein